MNSVVSIVICTRDRAASLVETLTSIGRCAVPTGLTLEVIVVDNGSRDQTATIVRNWQSATLEVRYLSEIHGGKSAGLNLAITHSRGDVLLFTDDDVRPMPQWVWQLCRPILDGEADAATGPIRMAAHLRRDWMTAEDYAAVACNETLGPPVEPIHMVGANMAIARRVLQRVGPFDEEIGPGVCPGGEDTLFSKRIHAAGFRIVWAPDALVEHDFDLQRLTRARMLNSSRGAAISDFFIQYHWMHRTVRCAPYHAARAFVKLQYYRVRRWREWWSHRSAPGWERHIVTEMYTYLHFWRNRGAPRKYSLPGGAGLAEVNVRERNGYSSRECVADGRA